MRYAILNTDKKVIDVRSEQPKSSDYIEITEEDVQFIVNAFNEDCFVFYKDNKLTKQKNIFKIKEELRKRRNVDLRKSDVLVLNDFWSGWTDDEKTAINNYRQDLRDYINNINTVEDVEKVEYPTAPEFAEKYI